MSIPFSPLPPEAFDEVARPHITRLNNQLRNLFALEGTITSDPVNNRSDRSIARNEQLLVNVNRVTQITNVSQIDRVAALGTAPAEARFRVLIGPPDSLYVSMQVTGGSWDWGFLFTMP